MYLISGTLFFIASFIFIAVNTIAKDVYYNQHNPLIIFLAIITFFIGCVFYYLQKQEEK